jgi:Icc-related predicted phosphoesterase
MAYKTVTVDVDVYVDEVIGDADDQELIDELESRGYAVTKEEVAEFDRYDWKLMLEVIDQQPTSLETRELREKLLRARFG